MQLKFWIAWTSVKTDISFKLNLSYLGNEYFEIVFSTLDVLYEALDRFVQDLC